MTKQKIRIRLKAYDHRVLDQSAKRIVETAERSGAHVVGPVPLPTKKERFTIRRSTFIDKDSHEHFEIRTHNRLIDVLDPDSKTIDMLMRLNLPAGVDIEIKDLVVGCLNSVWNLDDWTCQDQLDWIGQHKNGSVRRPHKTLCAAAGRLTVL